MVVVVVVELVLVLVVLVEVNVEVVLDVMSVEVRDRSVQKKSPLHLERVMDLAGTRATIVGTNGHNGAPSDRMKKVRKKSPRRFFDASPAPPRSLKVDMEGPGCLRNIECWG